MNKYPGEPIRRIGNWSGQVLAFALAMKPGDWVVAPRKSSGTIAVCEIRTGYTYDPADEPTYRHFRDVQWLNPDVPRSAFDQDLLYSFGAIMTVCEIKRNDAEKRVRAMAGKGWHSVPMTATVPAQSAGGLLASGQSRRGGAGASGPRLDCQADHPLVVNHPLLSSNLENRTTAMQRFRPITHG